MVRRSKIVLIWDLRSDPASVSSRAGFHFVQKVIFLMHFITKHHFHSEWIANSPGFSERSKETQGMRGNVGELF